MVFQDYALFPHLTISENIGFGLRKKTGRGSARFRSPISSMRQGSPAWANATRTNCPAGGSSVSRWRARAGAA